MLEAMYSSTVKYLFACVDFY